MIDILHIPYHGSFRQCNTNFSLSFSPLLGNPQAACEQKTVTRLKGLLLPIIPDLNLLASAFEELELQAHLLSLVKDLFAEWWN